ncbi:MAG: DUF6933 domain-containing protein [Gammaproteobacteria bacterium]
MVLRATRKLLKALPQSAKDSDVSDTALGDWYVNRIVVDRQPLLLLVSSKSRLSILAPARNVKTLPQRLAEMIRERLRRLDIASTIVDAEVEATGTVLVGRAVDRSITGQMVDFAKPLSYYLPVAGWDETTLRVAEARLAETPCLASRPFDEVIFPDKTAVRLLKEAWPASETRH